MSTQCIHTIEAVESSTNISDFALSVNTGLHGKPTIGAIFAHNTIIPVCTGIYVAISTGCIFLENIIHSSFYFRIVLNTRRLRCDRCSEVPFAVTGDLKFRHDRNTISDLLFFR